MKLEMTTVIGSIQVEDTGVTLLNHRVFKEKAVGEELYDLKLFIVDKSGNLVSELVVEADYGQAVGYISDWRITNHQ